MWRRLADLAGAVQSRLRNLDRALGPALGGTVLLAVALWLLSEAWGLLTQWTVGGVIGSIAVGWLGVSGAVLASALLHAAWCHLVGRDLD